VSRLERTVAQTVRLAAITAKARKPALPIMEDFRFAEKQDNATVTRAEERFSFD
jgi:hypothetical protein